MTEKRFTHDCFECKHSNWKFHDDVPFPLVEYLHCKLGHEKTSYNTPYDEDFTCDDYKHSYFVKSYLGLWIWSVYILMIVILIIIFYNG